MTNNPVYKTVPLDTLHADLDNARHHTTRNLDAIRKSLETFGQAQTLCVRAGTGVVIGGNGTLSVMRALGWTEARVCEVDLTDAQAKALAIALNRAGELGGWDNAKLAKALKFVDDSKELDLEITGFDDLDLEQYTAWGQKKSEGESAPTATDSPEEAEGHPENEDGPAAEPSKPKAKKLMICPKCGEHWEV